MRQRAILINGIAILGLMTTHSLVAGTIYKVPNSYHTDGRTAPKLQFDPEQSAVVGKTNDDLARSFLESHKETYGLTDLNQQLRLDLTKKSLLGTHYHFQQIQDGVPVTGAEIIVSVDNNGQHIYMVYNNLFPTEDMEEFDKSKARLTYDQAYDIAWQILGVSGELNARPRIKLVSLPQKGKMRLAYQVYLQVSNPMGAWEVNVDATTGEILSVNDMSLPRMPVKRQLPIRGSGAMADRRAAFHSFQAKEVRQRRFNNMLPGETVAQGTGLVFDPDPRTTLQKSDLKKDSPASDFESAYFERDLRDITYDGSAYSLKGPWVRLSDFERPSTAPSTTTDGKWTAKRGNLAFTDAMTYFHLDQSQRYIQSLGFTGDHGIQYNAIEVDANGVDGDDNSHFIPGTNQLAFGHGCVPDNEDADVILHEYGHAINWSINRNFRGGDTGAMGEGFGDYWAGSYSVSTPNGMSFSRDEVFTWDGHGPATGGAGGRSGYECWPGRILNAVTLRYDPARTYGAHESIDGQRSTDELWSTPLFQSLVTLIGQGVARADVDRVILEAQFGLGSSLKMRDMANAIIRTSERLLPVATPVFTDKFAAQNIIEIPRPQVVNGPAQVIGSRQNSRIFPGDTFALKIPLTNSGTAPASNVKLTAKSTTEGVTLNTAELSYGDMAVAQSVAPNDTLSVTVADSVACGTPLKFTLDVTYNGNLSSQAQFELQTGVPQGAAALDTADTAIPDNQAEGITRTLLIAGTNAKVTSNFTIPLKINHTFRGDLKVILISPRGTQVVLHNRTGGSTPNLDGVYPATLTSADSLSKLVGEDIDGTWTLKVSDQSPRDVGTLVSWGIKDISSYSCQ